MLAYSGGFGGLGPRPSAAPIETQSPWKDVFANPAAKKNLRLLFLGAGQQETGMVAPGQRLVRLFTEQGVNARWSDYPGGHVFSVWRNLLHETAPLLFDAPRSEIDLGRSSCWSRSWCRARPRRSSHRRRATTTG